MQTASSAPKHLLSSLPLELRTKVAEFRVETYRISAECEACRVPVLFFSERGCLTVNRPYYFVLDQGFLCASCARRSDGTLLCEVPAGVALPPSLPAARACAEH